MVNTSWTFRRKQSVAAIAAQWTASANFLFLVSAGLLLQFGALTTYGMFVAILASIGFAAVTLFLVIVALTSLWRFGAKAGWSAIRALLITALIAAPYLTVIILGLSLPPTFDTSSDRTNPPAFPIGARGVVQELPFMEWVMARDVPEPEDRAAIDSRRYTKDYLFVRKAAIEQAKAFGWVEQSRAGNDADNLRIGYQARTFFFNQPVDIVVRITEMENDVRVDMRSAFRLAVPDLGLNRRRIAAYFAALDEAVNLPKAEE